VPFRGGITIREPPEHFVTWLACARIESGSARSKVRRNPYHFRQQVQLHTGSRLAIATSVPITSVGGHSKWRRVPQLYSARTAVRGGSCCPLNIVISFSLHHVFARASTTNRTRHSRFWDAEWRSACEDIPRLLSNSKFYYRIHNNPPLILIRSRLNPINALFL
jgi:hypothetical protein